MENNTGNTIIALLTGALVGAGIGILFAPEKGSVTRAKIKTGYDESKDEIVHKFNEVITLLKNKGEHMKEDLESSIENLVSSGSYKAEEAIEFLEKQLVTLKEKNAKYHK